MLMKFFRLLIAGCITHGNCYSQDTLMTATWNNASIGKVKQDITTQTGLHFWDSTPATSFYVNLAFKNWKYQKVLDTIFNSRGFNWKKYPDQIAISQFTLKGKIINSKGEGLSFATIGIKGTDRSIRGDEQGNFSISHNKDSFTIIISMTGYTSKEKRVGGDSFVKINLESKTLESVSIAASKKSQSTIDTVFLNTPEILTGSVSIVDSSLRYPVPSRNMFEELRTLTGLVQFNPSASSQLNQSAFTIRNRITIFGDPHALIVLNGSIYRGDLNNINPLDIDHISIMKDAMASAQFGIQAANGVFIINTRSGAYNVAPKISATVNVTIGLKPDLFHWNIMPAGTHIEITKMLYQNGYYENIFSNAPATIVPPAAEILHKKDLGLLSDAAAEAALNELRNTDIRKEALKYLYRSSLYQQYHVNARGGSSTNHYYFSVGHDINQFDLTGNDDTRTSININNTIKLGRKAPQIHFSLYLSQVKMHNNGFDIRDILFPYEKLADEQGNALPVTQTTRQGYKDSIGSQLPDWNYRPLDEIRYRNNQLIRQSFLFSMDFKYNIWRKLETNISYSYQKETGEEENRHSLDTYFTRNLINQYTQVDTTGLWRAIPIGDILDEKSIKKDAQNLSLQLKFDIVKKESATFTLNAGSDIRHAKSGNKILRSYGVAPNGATANVNYATAFSMFYEPAITNTIPYVNRQADTIEHLYSFYLSGSYILKKRLAVSFHIRKDESNIFGVSANQKGVPLMSAGIGWDISKERFYHSNVFSQVKLRLSSGYCGNISRSFSALTGLQFSGTNPWSLPYSTIINPPNPFLSAETVRISNIGLEFSLLNNRIWGTAEYFEKEATNLLGLAPVDPTTGVSVFRGNVAAMKGHGIELALNSKFGPATFQWQTVLLLSYVRDRITDYSMSLPAAWYYCDPSFINPKEGKPLFAIYSLAFRGLDASNGDPIGILDNQDTKDYNGILQETDPDNLIYHGPATPVFFGSFRNTFIWKRLEFGFNITVKAGYYFKRNSIRYFEFLNGPYIGHSDIADRWQMPGDELKTDIPSLQFSGDPARDIFFTYSSALVEKGDHIRLQDIRIKYTWRQNKTGKRIKPSAEIYLYASNVGIIWRANKKGIDPDYANGIPAPLNITAGIKTGF